LILDLSIEEKTHQNPLDSFEAYIETDSAKRFCFILCYDYDDKNRIAGFVSTNISFGRVRQCLH
jgi:hypothetical protein